MTRNILPGIVVMLAMMCSVAFLHVDRNAPSMMSEASAHSIRQAPQQEVTSGQTTTVMYPGNSHAYNTLVSVSTGDLIKITASGLIKNSPGDGSIAPDGVNYCHCVAGSSILPYVAAYSLVGSITNSFTGKDLLDDGSDINPKGITGTSLGRPGIFGPGYVGSSFTGVAAASGEIYLAYNDTFPDDNAGSFTVSITVITTEALKYKSFLPTILHN